MIDPRPVQTTILVMPEDLNPHGTLFGGKLMAEMDKVAAMVAALSCGKKVVTLKVSEILFKQPVHLHDVCTLVGILKEHGTTSMKISVEVSAINPYNPDSYRAIAQASFVMVAVDDEGNPTPIREVEEG